MKADEYQTEVSSLTMFDGALAKTPKPTRIMVSMSHLRPEYCMSPPLSCSTTA